MSKLEHSDKTIIKVSEIFDFIPSFKFAPETIDFMMGPMFVYDEIDQCVYVNHLHEDMICSLGKLMVAFPSAESVSRFVLRRLLIELEDLLLCEFIEREKYDKVVIPENPALTKIKNKYDLEDALAERFKAKKDQIYERVSTKVWEVAKLDSDLCDGVPELCWVVPTKQEDPVVPGSVKNNVLKLPLHLQ